MSLSLVATPQPTNDPPRILLEVEESDPSSALRSVTLYRDGVRLRFDPVLSAQTAVAYDYDAPFDALLTYRADSVEISTAPEWSETWADLDDWTGADWSVAAGVASSSTPGAFIYRTTATAITQVDVTAPDNITIELLNELGGLAGSVKVTPDGMVTIAGSGAAVSVAGTGDFTLTIAEFSFHVAGTGWEATATFTGHAYGVLLKTPATGTASVEDIVVLGSGIEVTDSATDSATLSPTGDQMGAWLNNANQPDLAIIAEVEPLSSDDPYFIVSDSRQSGALAANSVELAIEGSSEVVTVATGPRRRERWTLNIACTTEAARQGLLSLLADSAAVLLRFPSTPRWVGIEGGFYAVGDVSTERIGHPQLGPVIIASLPLTPSKAPAYKPLWQWNMRTLAQTGMSMADVNAAYPTMRDLLIGPI